MSEPTIGILALQGDYAEHREVLERLGLQNRLVRHARELDSLGGLILPGGESTTMLKLLIEEALMNPLLAFHEKGGRSMEPVPEPSCWRRRQPPPARKLCPC